MSKLAVLSLLALLSLTLSDVYEQPEDVCQSSCVKRLYKRYCGGAECVHGTRTPEQEVAMCSAKCLDALSGQPLLKCLKRDLPRGADIQDFQDFLVAEINDYCFPEPVVTAMESEMADDLDDFEFEKEDAMEEDSTDDL